MTYIKDFISSFFFLLQSFFMWIPLWPLRWLWLKIFLKHLGQGTKVDRNVDIRKPWNVTIGSHCVINKNVLLDGRGTYLIIGDNVDIAQDVMIWSLTHDVNSPSHEAIKKKTEIEDHVWIGTRSIILAGVKIRKGAVVGAGSVVSKDVASKTINVGNPAHYIKDRINQLSYTLSHNLYF